MSEIQATGVTLRRSRRNDDSDVEEYADACRAAASLWIEAAAKAGISATIIGFPFDAIVDGPDSELLAAVYDGSRELILSIANKHFRSGPNQVITARAPRGRELDYFSLTGHAVSA